MSYVGTVGRQLLSFVESNPGDPNLCLALSTSAAVGPNSPTCEPFGEQTIYTTAGGQTVNGTRTIFGNQFGSNPYTKTAASSSYNSFQASFKHNDKYATMLLAYAYSKSIDNGSGLADPTNPYKPALSRGLSIFDLT